MRVPDASCPDLEMESPYPGLKVNVFWSILLSSNKKLYLHFYNRTLTLHSILGF